MDKTTSNQFINTYQAGTTFQILSLSRKTRGDPKSNRLEKNNWIIEHSSQIRISITCIGQNQPNVEGYDWTALFDIISWTALLVVYQLVSYRCDTCREEWYTPHIHCGRTGKTCFSFSPYKLDTVSDPLAPDRQTNLKNIFFMIQWGTCILASRILSLSCSLSLTLPCKFNAKEQAGFQDKDMTGNLSIIRNFT